MSMDAFLLIVLSVEVQLLTGVVGFSPESALSNYAAKCRGILSMSDPFERLDQLRENVTEVFFKSTDEIAEMLMHGPLGELTNGTGIRLLSTGLPYLKELSRTFVFNRNHSTFPITFERMRMIWNWYSNLKAADAISYALERVLTDVNRATFYLGHEVNAVQYAIPIFENEKNVTSLPWSEDCRRNVADADGMLGRMNEFFGTNCSAHPSLWQDTYYHWANVTGVKGGNSNRCLHKFLLRYSNYSEPVYSKFVDFTGTALFFALNLYALCLPIAYGATSVEKKNEAAANVAAISAQLKLALWDDIGTDATGQKEPISSTTVASEYWTDTAVMVAREAFGNATATWPSPGDPTAFYKIVGERIQKNLNEMFKYKVAVGWSVVEPREYCVLNVTSDVFYELRYNNVNYFVSRSGWGRDVGSEKMWQRLNDSGALSTIKGGLV